MSLRNSDLIFRTSVWRIGALRLSFVLPLVISAVMLIGQQPTTPNGSDPTTSAINLSRPDPAELPFSAIRYWHKVKALPDGTTKFLRHERHPALWARDATGRVRIQTIEFRGACDRPTELVPPECEEWGEDVFDPRAQTITGWIDGPFAADVTIVVPLTPEEVSELLVVTSELHPPSPPNPDKDSNSTKITYLGEKSIEGLRASGVRTTFNYPAGYSGSTSPVTRIYEVWTSPELKMPIRVIYGDPEGDEMVWGLEKITLDPDSKLFLGPESYSLQRPTHLDQSVKSFYIEHFTNFYSH